MQVDTSNILDGPRRTRGRTNRFDDYTQGTPDEDEPPHRRGRPGEPVQRRIAAHIGNRVPAGAPRAHGDAQGGGRQVRPPRRRAVHAAQPVRAPSPILDIPDDQVNDNDMLDGIPGQEAAVGPGGVALSPQQVLASHLKMAADGNPPPQPLHEAQSMREAMQSFVSKCYQQELYFCQHCSEVHLDKLVTGSRNALQGGDREQLTGCRSCVNDWKQHLVFMYGKQNSFDPFYTADPLAMAAYAALPELSEIEQMLIALHQPVMKVYRIKGGAMGFSGNVINLPQNVDDLLDQLPRTLPALNVIVVRRNNGTPDNYKDFKVNKNTIMAWLTFLRQFNRYYRHIRINQQILNELPEDPAEVHQQLRHFDADEPPQGNGAAPPDDLDENQVVNDGGLHAGPNLQQPVALDDAAANDDGVLETGVALNVAAQPAEQVQVDELLDRIVWPTRQTLPLDEFRTPGLFAKTFPTLFPFGIGDPFDNGRDRQSPPLNASIKHFIRYAIPNGRGGYKRPFDMNPRFAHYIQDVDERHRIFSEAKFYLKSNPQDANNSLHHIENMSMEVIYHSPCLKPNNAFLLR